MTTEKATIPGPSENSKESLLRELKGIAGKADQRMKDSRRSVSDGLSATGHAVSEQACQAATVSQTYVRENPWKVISVAAVIGAFIGVLLGRR